MAGFVVHLLLIVALVFVTWKYLRLREMTSGEGLPDLACLQGLSSLLDTAEGYAAPHAATMAAEAEALGRRLGLAEPTLLSLRLAALVHDAGQINLPRDLFKKPGPLTAEEWFLVRTHPLIGELALRQALPALSDVPALVRWHHERWDGTGYPDRLLATEIPLPARILAVADAAAAMAQPRPYRPARSAREIAEELGRQAGLQFDPEVVQAWVAQHGG
ncbi:MAG: GAF domain/HD domain protein [Candidatus Ozemobacter sibiricus]|jgi:HD-GYP domain-containing protein (c-di-GMP phosphodiesterase class II)|uniref:GAF domain/HD domain protein n=1 Tax=Candidatus Ozemobacter sibiricus TaxID=2268124 RepID=A0A367ZN94_9BACT|nr:MAG: GAF domain/HD domain protein [Candidatus Ozemobacter sibiricus]